MGKRYSENDQRLQVSCLPASELKEMGGNFRVTFTVGSDDHPSYYQVSLTELASFIETDPKSPSFHSTIT